jgi:hypothetical protein
MTTTLADYQGRLHDVAAFRGQVPAGEALLDGTLFDAESAGEICVGVVKLAQWFLIELMTERGSRPYDDECGTTFMTELRTGRLRTELDVFVAFNFAVGDIQARARSLESDTDPADERFADAVLQSAVIFPGYVQLHIAVTSRAGNTRKAILPIATTTS